MKEKMKVINLLFTFGSSAFPRVLEPKPILLEEVEELKADIKKLELENSELQLNLGQSTKENQDLKWESQQIEKNITTNNKRPESLRVRRNGLMMSSMVMSLHLRSETKS